MAATLAPLARLRPLPKPRARLALARSRSLQPPSRHKPPTHAPLPGAPVGPTGHSMSNVSYNPNRLCRCRLPQQYGGSADHAFLQRTKALPRAARAPVLICPLHLGALQRCAVDPSPAWRPFGVHRRALCSVFSRKKPHRRPPHQRPRQPQRLHPPPIPPPLSLLPHLLTALRPCPASASHRHPQPLRRPRLSRNAA